MVFSDKFVSSQKPLIMKEKENDIDLTLECASKVREHLNRVLENKKEIALKLKLHYVDELILEADTIKKDIATYS